jgi:hypothetical protein
VLEGSEPRFDICFRQRYIDGKRDGVAVEGGFPIDSELGR